MNSYIALLRGINVGGRNIVRMQALRTLLGSESVGYKNVATYIQSGNIVFQTAVPREKDQLADEIGSAMEAEFGFRPRIMILTASELRHAIEQNPFPEAADEPKTLHVYFCKEDPAQPELAALDQIKRESERFVLEGSRFYLHAPEGIGRSKLAERVERLLGVATTARNWRSIGKILALVEKL